MDTKTKTTIMKKARRYLNTGWHCSEGILKAVGEHYLGEINPQTFRISTAFEGGVGGTNEELCGALSGGLMVIGALYGRTDPRKSDYRSDKLAAAYRARFLKHFRHTHCADLKAHWVGRKGQETCAELVADAAEILIDVLEEEEKES
ncbi:MAG: C_GCAxxG_C_C family protein [Anaerolineaceae bacterium]|nr:C_GCAxxG_C_C family protein [Anaerolineaceae bacterium]